MEENVATFEILEEWGGQSFPHHHPHNARVTSISNRKQICPSLVDVHKMQAVIFSHGNQFSYCEGTGIQTQHDLQIPFLWILSCPPLSVMMGMTQVFAAQSKHYTLIRIF